MIPSALPFAGPSRSVRLLAAGLAAAALLAADASAQTSTAEASEPPA